MRNSKKVLQALTGEKVSKDPRISLKDRCRVNNEKRSMEQKIGTYFSEALRRHMSQILLPSKKKSSKRKK